jgi:cysteinyl-tRNA synthetase
VDLAEIDSATAKSLLTRFDQHLEDDFNSAGAVGVLFDAAHEVNRAGSSGEAADLRAVFRQMVRVLGLPLEARREQEPTDAAPFIELLIQVRSGLRTEGQWALADLVRDGLKELGISLHDSPEGTTWQREDEI